MTTADKHALEGLSLLIVEDEMLLAMSLEDMLAEIGCRTVTAPNVSKALARIELEHLDGALLDVNLRGARVYPVAEELERREIPFLFVTGYDRAALDERWRARPMVRKPFDLATLLRVAAPLFAPPDSSSS